MRRERDAQAASGGPGTAPPGIERGASDGAAEVRHSIEAAARAEAQLHETHESALETAHTATWYMDGETGRFRASRTLPAVVGGGTHTYDSLLDALGALVHSEDRDRVISEVAAAVRNARQFEVCHRLPTGAATDADDARWARLCGRPVRRDTEYVGVCGTVTDITRERREQVRLQEAADRFGLFIEHHPDAVAIHQNGIAVYVNRIGLELIGASSLEEVLGKPILEFVHPDSIPQVVERLAAMPDEPGAHAPYIEERFVKLDGTEIDAEVCSTRTVWEGQPAYQVIFRDISERKAREAEIRYQAELVRQVSDAIVATDRELRIESWNAAAERLLGWRGDEIAGRPLTDVVATTLFDGVGEVTESVFFPAGTLRAEEVLYRKDGEPVRARISASPVRNADAVLTGTVAVLSDVTRWRQAEQEYGAVLAALHEGVVLVDPDGKIRSANTAATGVLAREDEYLAGRNFFDLPIETIDEQGNPVADEEHPVSRTARTAKASAGTVLGIVRPRTGGASDHDITWLSVNCAPLHAADGARLKSVVCSFTDITARREIDRMKDEFISIVSHELRTPLTSIRGALEYLARRGLEGVSAEAREMVRIACDNSERLTRMINNLLDVKRIESGDSQDLAIEMLSPQDLVDAAIADRASSAVRKEIDLVSSVCEIACDMLVPGDRAGLVQVLTCLISNAVAYTPAGAAVKVGADVAAEDRIRFWVTDEGPGIPPDQREKLFQKFHQLDSSDRRRHGGTGLGLAIAKGIVRQHRGEIGVASEPGRGATFWFELAARRA